MASPPKPRENKMTEPRAETTLEKTTRVAVNIIQTETERRLLKTAHLRKARLEMAADEADEAVPHKATGAHRKPPHKAAV
ncbi:hypothetical protein SAMN05421759_11481 [Roseivivax lentus]|uniref:Transposase n=1 Tax=Roseivivax lentus TaxID=633194 RepID=A0A1N7PCU5_9RHOB|nr:hypothetical protein [Roseivivax lentus]SIT08422.1 hypothetical protein SAMN05421759_11481 [Roseivivax lentus]